jgi:hypothetical protein
MERRAKGKSERLNALERKRKSDGENQSGRDGE